MEHEDFTREHEAYLRDEISRGMAQLDRGEFSRFDAPQIIAEERARHCT